MRLGGQIVTCLILILAMLSTEASAGPLIEVSDDRVGNSEDVLVGGALSATIAVTNTGDAPLTVSEIGAVEKSVGPRGWLSVSETDLYVLPEPGNGVEFEIHVDGSSYDFPSYVVGEVFLRSDAVNNDSLVINVLVVFTDPEQEVFWDVVKTDWRLFGGLPIDRECVGVAISSHGAIGVPGWRRQHLDYFESGFECGARDADKVYLNSSSSFVLINDGGSVSLTTSIYQSGVEKDYHWRPAPGSSGLEHGFVGGYGSYEFSRTGKLLNRDGRIAMERLYIAPRTPPGHSTYIVVRTRMYSGDGQEHNHVTLGSVTDWDVPSDQVAVNSSGVSTWSRWGKSQEFIYMQGTDTAGSTNCQLHSDRYAASVLILGLRRWYTGQWWRFDRIDSDTCGAWAGPQALLRDTSLARDGSPLDPPQPDGQAWWDDIAAHEGYASDPTEGNQAVWRTYFHDFDLGAQDTLTFWSVLTTVREGSPNDLQSHVGAAFMFLLMKSMIEWYGCCACCVLRVGDANGLGGDEPTIADISVIIDALFISGVFRGIPCLAEADVNQNGGCCSNYEYITIGDISVLIDYLFITGQSLGLPPCVW